MSLNTNALPAGRQEALTAEEAVRALAEARRLGSTADIWWTPASVEEAYAAQSGVRTKLGEGIGGWKAAGLDPDGIPLLATIHTSDVSASGQLQCPSDGWVLEVEYGYRLGRDLPGASSMHLREVMAAVEEVHVCFELCHSRLAAPRPPRLLFVADGLANDRLVVGTGVALATLSGADRDVQLHIDGELVQQVRTPAGEAAMETFLWLARQSLPDGGLRAGQVVITGSLTGPAQICPGQVAKAAIMGVGQVWTEAVS